MNNLRWTTVYCAKFRFVFLASILHEVLYVLRDISVGIATLYVLDGSRIESRWMRVFSHSSRTTIGPIHPPVQWVPNLILASKSSGTWLWQSTSSSAKVKERVELYVYSSSGSSWPVLGWNLPYLVFVSQKWFVLACNTELVDL